MTLMETLRAIADAVEDAISKIPDGERGSPLGMGADGTTTSQIDKIAENTVLDYIVRNNVPLNILSEEIGFVDNGASETLVLDPIDGTSNAIAGVPMFTISMAVGKDRLSNIHTALLRNLVTEDEMVAEKGKGAFKNGVPMHVASNVDVRELCLLIYLGKSAHPDSFALAKRVSSSRSYGCASLEMELVAEGKAEAYYMNSEKYSREIRVVDIAASYLLLKEAGGEILDLEGKPFDMPFDLEIRSNFIAFCERKVYDFIMKKESRTEKHVYGICANMNISNVVDYANRVIKALSGQEIVLEEDIAKALNRPGTPLGDMEVDIMITIGGDGTILRTLMKNDAPLVGINAGGVGFLADVDVEDIEEGIKRLVSGDYTIEERTRVVARYNSEDLADAVNEVVVHTDTIAKIRHFKVYVDDHLMTEVRADGIIVSTPTGSTCYAMSLGAPIIDPKVNGMVIVPMAAYKFASRPFVVPIGAKVTIESITDRGCLIVADGQEEFPMEGKSSVTIMASGRKSRFIMFNTDFYRRVREKLVNAI
jgi:NAD+ kinase